MGYEVFIYKFEKGDASGIPHKDVDDILSKYGKVVEGNFGLEFMSSVGDVCDYCSLSADDHGQITCIQFSRPTISEELPEIVFDLLSIQGTCFFGPDLEFMQSRYSLGDNLPDALQEHFPDGPQIITRAGESWPLK